MSTFFVNRLPTLVFLLLLVVQTSVTHAQQRIVVLGDSISAAYGISVAEGWVQLLKDRIANENIKVINASISGETTSGGSTRISQVLHDHKPSILILELGANDGLRGLSIQTMRANLSTIIEQTLNHPARILLLGMNIPANYGQTYTSQFEQTYSELAQTYQLELVPSFLGTVGLDYDLMQEDGIHPNSAAQTILLDQLWPKLKVMLQN
jgi:acyl-CoA thioesterase I